MINTLTLGKQNFSVNLIQGPLAGISCSSFRKLVWEYSKPAFTCTEMISCKTLLYQVKSNYRFTHIDPQEGPVCFQLSGSDPKELAEATQLITNQGASLIDLNCGCPVNKIRAKGAGSSLLANPKKLYQLILAMKNNTHLPVSIKIRVDGLSNTTFNNDIINVVNDSGVDFITVHGRHWTERYDTPCRYDQIEFFVANLTIPVIGNGDVACEDSLKRMMQTGCAGAMIGRASVGQPWLIGQLLASCRQEAFLRPSVQKIGQLFIEHVYSLSKLLNNEKFAIIQARKFAKYYARDIEQRMDFCFEINQCQRFDDFQHICENYFITQ